MFGAVTAITCRSDQMPDNTPMNGYEKHSRDYGGPPPGWGTDLLMIVVVGLIAAPAVLRLIEFFK